MIYEANQIDWPIGSIVIHDADAKQYKMLMRVIAHKSEKSGLRYITEYLRMDLVYPGVSARVLKKFNKNTWNNPKESLHDPARFGLKINDLE